MHKIREFIFLYKNTFIWGFILVIITVLSFGGVYYFGLIKRENEEIIENQLSDIANLEIKNSVENKEENIEEQKNNIFNLIKVDIKGKVKNPGVYEVDADLRVIDAIKKAGGVTTEADTSVINLSKKLYDEMVIIVYSKSEVKNISEIKKIEEEKQKVCLNNEKLVNGACVIISENNEENLSSKKVSINTNDIKELLTLSGIGESKAKEIIEYRKTNGNFKKIEDIMNVEGIGVAIFDKIKENITI